MREIEDILLNFIVGIKYTIFSGIQQSKHKGWEMTLFRVFEKQSVETHKMPYIQI